MKRTGWLSSFLIVSLLVASLSSARDFFVSPSGEDTQDGSKATPWRTLQHAADSVKPGDTVVVSSGTFAGFQVRTSGTADARICFQGKPGTHIVGDNASTPDGINLELVSYVDIKGFMVSKSTRAGIRVVGTASQPSKGVSISGNKAISNGIWGIFTGFADDVKILDNEAAYSGSQHGIYVSNSGDRPVIKGNLVHHNQACGIHINADVNSGGDGVIEEAYVSGNAIFANGSGGGAAINLDGVIDSRIENNLIFNNKGAGIALFQIDGARPSSNNTVINNTISQPFGARWGIALRNGARGNTLANNIVQHAGPKGALLISRDSLPKTSSDYHAFCGPLRLGNRTMRLADWQQQTKLDKQSFNFAKNDLFSRTKKDYYSLAPDSRAIDAGTKIDAPEKDFTGAPRPAGENVDIGAYEYNQ